MLTASFFSYLLGVKFPGPGTIYLAQSIRFTAPVRMGERLRYRLVVNAQKPDRPIYTLSTEIFGEDGRPRLTGEATIKVTAATDGSIP